jgi:hypothetical protein
MFRGWALLAAIVVLAAWAASAPPNPIPTAQPQLTAAEQPGPQQPNSAQTVPDKNQGQTSDAPPSLRTNAPPDNLGATPAKEQDQHEPPWWLWWQYSGFWIALFTLILTGSTIGLWYVTWRTLRHTEQSTETELRAYVSIQKVVQTASAATPAATAPITGWAFSLTWQNTGKTPTRDMTQWVSLKYFGPDEPIVFAAMAETDYGAMIGPSCTITASPVLLAMESCVKIKAGDGCAFLFGGAKYNDVFEGTPRHEHGFCFKLSVISDLTKIGGTPFGLESHVLGNFST